MEMDLQALNARCVELFASAAVQRRMWMPTMFWDVGKHQVVPLTPDVLNKPKVDPCELEVMLSAAAGVTSTCAEALEAREPGRAAFIARSVRIGERPLLRRPEQADPSVEAPKGGSGTPPNPSL